MFNLFLQVNTSRNSTSDPIGIGTGIFVTPSPSSERDNAIIHKAMARCAQARSCLSTPPFPSNSCACLASSRGNRCAMSGLILLLFKEVEQGDQILSKQCRFHPFKPLDAIGEHPFPARKKPAASNVQPEDGDSTKAMTTTRTT